MLYFCGIHLFALKGDFIMKIIDGVITSRTNKNVLYAASLLDKKGREKSGSFIVEGEKLFLESVSSSLDIECVFLLNSRADRLIEFIEKNTENRYENVPVYVVEEHCFSKISTEKSPQGIITVIKSLDNYKKYNIINNIGTFSPQERMIFLYSMRDPSNLGAVVRSAVAFGADRIILSADCADPLSPKALRAAMGSLFRVKIDSFEDFSSAIRAVQQSGRRVFAAELSENAVSLSDAQLTSADVVIIGNEGHGIDKEISAICDGSVYIPISSKTESLNASVAAAIFMWEQRR